MDAATVKVMRKLYGLGRPACRVYGRSDCFLVQPMALFGHVYLMHVGPVTRLRRDATAAEVGAAALAALEAYAEHSDREPSRELLTGQMQPLLKAAGVKSPRGFTLGSSMVSVERAVKRISIVPYNSDAQGTQTRMEPRQVNCPTQPGAVGQRIIELLAEQNGVNRYHREDERAHRDEIEAERRAVLTKSRSRATPTVKRKPKPKTH